MCSSMGHYEEAHVYGSINLYVIIMPIISMPLNLVGVKKCYLHTQPYEKLPVRQTAHSVLSESIII